MFLSSSQEYFDNIEFKRVIILYLLMLVCPTVYYVELQFYGYCDPFI